LVIRDEPREAVGIPEDALMKLEEQISNLIHDQCHPVIIPDIGFRWFAGVKIMTFENISTFCNKFMLLLLQNIIASKNAKH